MTPALRDVCTLIVDCEHKTAPPEPGAPHPLIRTPDIGLGRLLLDQAQRVTDATYDVWTKRARPRPGDLILAREAPVGNVGIIPSGVDVVLGQRTVLIRPDPKKADAHFLNYLLSGPSLRAWMDGVSSGATVPHLNMADIRAMPLPPLPPLTTQKKVAGILSAYDELIKNNSRRIQILEEISRRIFREWFVDFRYPGYEVVPCVETDVGLIPQDWSVTHVREIASYVRGRSYRGADLVDTGGVPFINLKCVNRDGGFRREGIKRYVGPYTSAQTVTTGDIVVAVTDMTQERRVVARAARVPPLDQQRGVVSMDLVKVLPEREIPLEYLLGLLRFSSFPDAVKQHANGANVLHLHPDRIRDYCFPRPPRALMDEYAQIARDLNAQGDVLDDARERLALSRDLLLPRLVSGQIELEDLDILVDEAAA